MAYLRRLRAITDSDGKKLYVDEKIGVDLNNTVYALDAATIDLCLSVFPWAHFRSTKAAVKLHILLDLCGSIPTFIHISDGKMHDINVLDLLIPEPRAFYVMDRGYMNFGRLYELHQGAALFLLEQSPIYNDNEFIQTLSTNLWDSNATRP